MMSNSHTAGSSTRPIGAYSAMIRSRSLNGRLGRANSRKTCSTITKCTRVSHAFSARGSTTVRIAESSVRARRSRRHADDDADRDHHRILRTVARDGRGPTLAVC